MNAMPTIEIAYADGRKQSQVIHAASLVLGTDAKADVRVEGAPELAAAQLLLMLKSNGCWVATAKDANVSASLAGRPFDNGILPFGTELDVGSITLRVLRDTKSRKLSPKQLLLLAAPFAAAFFWLSSDSQGLPRTAAEPPDLFAERSAPGTCHDEARATAFARERMFTADSMEIRYAFDPIEGLRALDVYAEAEACALFAKDVNTSEELRRRRLELERRIDGDFRSWRVRLDRGMAHGDASAILASARAMRTYLTFRPGPYRDWLAVVERQVATSVEKQRRKQ